jgi:flagellar hook-associated protein 3 FlgL
VPISIYALRGSQAAWDLGLIPPGLDRKDGVLSLNGSQIVGTDPNPQEVRGVFNSLLRLREALTKSDAGQIARASGLLDEDLDRLSGSRGSLGISLQQIDDLQRNHEDRQNELKAAESENLDADMASVITELNARQVAYEAGLKLLANNSKLSIFDFI